MKSTLEFPLLFFEHALTESGLKEIFSLQIDYYGFVSYQIDVDKMTVNYVEQDENGDFKKGHFELNIEKYLLPVLRRQLKISKELLYFSFKKNTGRNDNFLLLIFNTVQTLIDNKKKLIEAFPHFLLVYRDIVAYINQRLKERSSKDFILNEENIKVTIKSGLNIVGREGDNLIDSIFNFMEGNNERDKKILSKEDFELLKEYTSFLVENNKVPVIKKKLNPKLRISTIRFLYWVLHFEKFKSCYPIEESYYFFTKEVFVNSGNPELITIKQHFGTKSRVKNRKVLPEIVLNHLEN